MTRPAITAILRLNYPVAQRGHVTATVRQWSSLSFVVVLISRRMSCVRRAIRHEW